MYILLVEDNPGDVGLVREALNERKSDVQLRVVSNGWDALAFLRHHAPYANAPVPDLVFLDLHLPLKSGYEVLAEVKHDPELQGIPVVVLTTTDNRQTIARCYELGASAYLVKPIEVEKFVHAVRGCIDFLRACKRVVKRKPGPRTRKRR